jgi:hypothetical protein
MTDPLPPLAVRFFNKWQSRRYGISARRVAVALDRRVRVEPARHLFRFHIFHFSDGSRAWTTGRGVSFRMMTTNPRGRPAP